MSNTVMVDTSIAVNFLRGHLSFSMLQSWGDDWYLSAVVIGELSYGAYKANKPQRLSELVRFQAIFGLVSVDETTSKIYGGIMAELAQSGTLIPENDLWIAASAIEHDFTLVSADAHFNRVLPLRHRHVVLT